MSSTIRVRGSGSVDERLRDLEQSNNYGEVILSFDVVDEIEGGGSVSVNWTWKTGDGTTDPGARNMAVDVAAAPTMLRFSTTDVNGSDVRNVLATIKVGDTIFLQQRTDSSKWAQVQVRAAVVDHTTWFEVPSTLIANSGAGYPANNMETVVRFDRGAGSGGGATGPPGPAGPTGPTGPAGPAGVGVPTGGTTGQVLTKTSATDYATAWQKPRALWG